jgi:pimeloyl-ACP methyl ester carboxylesterase
LVDGLEIPFDVYLPDHRGTGYSEFLKCPIAEALQTENALQECGDELRAKWGDRLSGFTASNSARDVLALIERTRRPDQRLYIQGASYGSYWAHRYLQLATILPDGILMDGNCHGDACHFDAISSGYNEGAMHVFEECAADPFCASRLGASPWETLRQTLDKVEAECSVLGMNRNMTRMLLAYAGVSQSNLLPSLVYRLNRCSPADIAAVQHLLSTLQLGYLGAQTRFGPEDTGGFSRALQLHVATSELYSNPLPSDEELKARDDALLVSPGYYYPSHVETWPRYPRDQYVDKWATTELRLLMLHGTFDMQTPLSLYERARVMLPQGKLTAATVRGGGHGVMFKSVCAANLVMKFLSGAETLDTSCLAALPPPNFQLPVQEAQYWYGVEDAWDG